MNSVSQTRHVAVLLVILVAGGAGVVGCSGPTRTAGTGSMAAKELAVLSIPQLPQEAHVQIDAIQFDDADDKYEIKKGRDFYLKPGDHTASFNFVAKVPKIEGAPMLVGWLIPSGKSISIPGPQKVPLGSVAAGKAYELAPPTPESLDKLMETMQNGGGLSLSLVREKTGGK